MNKIYTEISSVMVGALIAITLAGCTTSNNVIITAAPTYCVSGGYSTYTSQHPGYAAGVTASCSCPNPYSNSHSSFNSCCYRKATYPVYNQDSAAMVSTGSYYYQYHK